MADVDNLKRPRTSISISGQASAFFSRRRRSTGGCRTAWPDLPAAVRADGHTRDRSRLLPGRPPASNASTNIVPLLPYADALMLTRGILRSTIPATFGHGVVLRASGGPSVLKELSNELLAVDVEDAARLNVAAMAVQVYVGGEFETQTINNLTRLVDMGNRYGIPTLGVTAVGKNMTRDARYFRLACRICAELGAHVVKTYYVSDGFETITASPVPCRS
jgi:hypothetical protein